MMLGGRPSALPLKRSAVYLLGAIAACGIGTAQAQSDSGDYDDNYDESLNPGAGRTPRFLFSPSIRAGVRYQVNSDFALDFLVRHKHASYDPAPIVRGTNASAAVRASVRVGEFNWRNQIDVKQTFVNFYGPKDYAALVVSTGLAREFALGESGWSFTPVASISFQQADDRLLNRWKYALEGSFAYNLTEQLSVKIGPRAEVRVYTSYPLRRADTIFAVTGGFDYELTKGVSIGSEISYQYSKSSLSRARFSQWLLEPQIKARFTF